MENTQVRALLIAASILAAPRLASQLDSLGGLQDGPGQVVDRPSEEIVRNPTMPGFAPQYSKKSRLGRTVRSHTAQELVMSFELIMVLTKGNTSFTLFR